MMRNFCFLLLTISSLIKSSPAQTAPVTLAEETQAEEVLAEMTGYQLTRQEFGLILRLLFPQETPQQLDDPEKKAQNVKTWMEVMVLYEEALAEHLNQDPSFEQQVDLFKKRLLAELHRNRLLAAVQVSEKQAKKYYDAHQEEYRRSPRVKVHHILVPTRTEASEIKLALDQGGSFQALAKKHSRDHSSKDKGGDLGWIKSGKFHPTFTQTAFALTPGKTSEPVQSPFGWHIIWLTDKKDTEYRDFDEVKEAIFQQLLAWNRQRVLEQTSRDLFEKYHVRIPPRQE